MQPTPHLFGPEGQAAIDALLRRRPLLAFDFDGTLAPIVARPQDARISQAVAQRLQRLGQRLPVAIVTGRAVDDVRGRLGFEPQFVVGNHGAEECTALPPHRPGACARPAASAAYNPSARAGRRRRAGRGQGQSIALHYRLGGGAKRPWPDPSAAGGRHSTFSGKMVENIVAAGAPDKSHAVIAGGALLTSSAFFAGDDVNDEPVFATGSRALAHGAHRPRPCRYMALLPDSPVEVALLLQRLLEGWMHSTRPELCRAHVRKSTCPPARKDLHPPPVAVARASRGARARQFRQVFNAVKTISTRSRRGGPRRRAGLGAEPDPHPSGHRHQRAGPCHGHPSPPPAIWSRCGDGGAGRGGEERPDRRPCSCASCRKKPQNAGALCRRAGRRADPPDHVTLGRLEQDLCSLIAVLQADEQAGRIPLAQM